ncbi:hypothetical protein LGAA44_100048 [Leuconostoc gasicomitatum]|nr:hypothetical protein LGAA44_100048 [Leuconostoc gasicomitatum]
MGGFLYIQKEDVMKKTKELKQDRSGIISGEFYVKNKKVVKISNK